MLRALYEACGGRANAARRPRKHHQPRKRSQPPPPSLSAHQRTAPPQPTTAERAASPTPFNEDPSPPPATGLGHFVLPVGVRRAHVRGSAPLRRRPEPSRPEQCRAFHRVVTRAFVPALRAGGRFRAGRRVKRVQPASGIYELTGSGGSGPAGRASGSTAPRGAPAHRTSSGAASVPTMSLPGPDRPVRRANRHASGPARNGGGEERSPHGRATVRTTICVPLCGLCHRFSHASAPGCRRGRAGLRAAQLVGAFPVHGASVRRRTPGPRVRDRFPASGACGAGPVPHR